MRDEALRISTTLGARGGGGTSLKATIVDAAVVMATAPGCVRPFGRDSGKEFNDHLASRFQKSNSCFNSILLRLSFEG
jgi:hypothetical protein